MNTFSIKYARPQRRARQIRAALFAAVLGFAGTYMLLGRFPLNDAARVDQLGFNADTAIYLDLPRALIESGKYEFNYIPHTRFPPGLPVLFALFTSVFGESYALYQFVVLLCFLLGLWFAYELLAKRGGHLVAVMAVLLLGTSPYSFELATQLLNSDLPYLCISFLTLLTATLLDRAEGRRRRIFLAVFFAFCVTGALMVRSAGISLAAGFALWLLLCLARRQDALRRVKLFAPALAAAAAAEASWILWTHRVQVKHWPGEFLENYVAQIMLRNPHYPELGPASAGDLVFRVAENMLIQMGHALELLTRLDWINPFWSSPLIIVPLVLLLLGLFSSLRYTEYAFIDLYFVCYLALYLLWPFDEHERFMHPIFPLAVFYLWRGVKVVVHLLSVHGAYVTSLAGLFSSVMLVMTSLAVSGGSSMTERMSLWFWALAAGLFVAGSFWSAGRERNARALRPLAQAVMPATFAVFVAAGMVKVVASAQDTKAGDPRTYRHYPSVEAGRWLAANTEPQAVAMAEIYTVVHGVSRRRVVPYPQLSNPADIFKTMQRFKVAYLVVVDDDQYPYFYPTEETRLHSLERYLGNRLAQMHRGSGFTIYRIKSV